MSYRADFAHAPIIIISLSSQTSWRLRLVANSARHTPQKRRPSDETVDGLKISTVIYTARRLIDEKSVSAYGTKRKAALYATGMPLHAYRRDECSSSAYYR